MKILIRYETKKEDKKTENITLNSASFYMYTLTNKYIIIILDFIVSYLCAEY